MFLWIPNFFGPDSSSEYLSHISNCFWRFPCGYHKGTSNLTLPNETLDFTQTLSSSIFSISVNATPHPPNNIGETCENLRDHPFFLHPNLIQLKFALTLPPNPLPGISSHHLHLGHAGPLHSLLCILLLSSFHSLHLSQLSEFKRNLFFCYINKQTL